MGLRVLRKVHNSKGTGMAVGSQTKKLRAHIFNHEAERELEVGVKL